MANKKRKTGYDAGLIAKSAFRYSKELSPAASPVANYSIPTPTNKAGELADILKELTTLTVTGTKAFTEYQTKKGMEEASRGKDRPASTFFNKARIDGYDIFQGKANVGAIQEQLKGLHEAKTAELAGANDIKAMNKIHETYAKDAKKLLDNVLKDKSPKFIEGMQADVASYQNTLGSAFENAQMKRLQGIGLENIAKISDYEGQRVKEKVASQTQDPKEFAASVSKSERTLLTELQFVGKNLYQVPKQVISKQFIANRGQKAILNGDPESMMFVEELDTDGTRLIDNPDLREDAYGFIKQALSAQETLRARQVKAQEEAEEAAVTDIEQIFSTAIGAGVRDPKAIAAFKAALMAYSRVGNNKAGIALSPERIDHYFKAINALEADEDFQRDESASVTYTNLFVRAANGEDILSDLVNNKSRLIRGDYTEILKQYLKAAATKRTAGKQTQLEKAGEEMVARLRDSFLKIKDVPGLEKLLDPAKTVIRQQRGVLYARQMYAQLLADATPEKPFTFKHVNEIYEAARYQAYLEFPIEVSNTGVPIYNPYLQEPPEWYAGPRQTQVKGQTATPKFDTLELEVNLTK